MASGHAKNITNFETVTNLLDSLVTVYNPSQTSLLLAALQDRLEEASALLDEIDTALVHKNTKVDEIQAELEDLDCYVVSLKGAAEFELGDEALTRDLQNIVERLNPKSRSTSLTGGALTSGADDSRTKLSASQPDRDERIAQFAAALALLKTRTDYDPPAADHKIAGIETKLTALTAKNDAANAAEAALASALAARDRVLYDDETGIIKLVKLIKIQLALKPGKTSAAYQQINALEFRKYR